MTGGEASVAIVLAAHGDRGGDGANKHLAAHAKEIAENGDFAGVFYGVLNGNPLLENALDQADGCGASQIIVYPLFMSAGYFVKTVLADRVAAQGLRTPTGIMQPLGMDKRLALLMLEHSLRTSKAAGIVPGEARLLVVGHGSKHGPESADATKRAARMLSSHSPYTRVETAFIEEEPLLKDALERYDGTTVVAGFLSGDGLHAGEDIPDAIKETGAHALYTGPIGLHPRIPDLVLSSLMKALEDEDDTEVATAIEPMKHDALSKAVAAGKSPAETPKPAPEAEPVKAETLPESEPEPAPEPRPEPRPEAVSPPRPEQREEVGAGLETPSVEAVATSAGSPSFEAKAASRMKRRGGSLGLAVKTVAGLFVLAILGMVAIPFFVSEDLIRDRAISLVKEKTGRTLAIAGKTSFAIFPNVGVEMENVSISNPPGMEEGETLRMKALNLNLKLMPLFSKRVEIDRFVLDQPVFSLVVDSQGRKNWDVKKTAAAWQDLNFANVTQKTSPRHRMAYAQAGGTGSGAVQSISLGTVTISQGTVNYANAITNENGRVEVINVTLVQPQMTEPLEVSGDLVWKAEKVEFDGWLENVPALLGDNSSGARFNFSTRLARGSFDGAFAVSPGLAAKGTIRCESPSVRELAGWLGKPLPPGGGLGPLAIKSDLSLVGEKLDLSNSKLSIDGMSGDGQVEVRLKGVRPFVSASLSLDKLDLNQYAENQASATRSVNPTGPGQEQPSQSPQPKSGDSLTDFIKKLDGDATTKPRTQVRAWSQEAVDYSGFRAVDADLKLSAKTILYRNIKTGASDVDANIRSGVLTANLTKLLLYDGTGTGKVTLNGARAVPGLAATFNLDGISALPLLKEVANFEWLSGKANLAFNIAGSGRSQTEIMRSLQGQGNFNFLNGAIEGINIPEMVRGLKQGHFDGWKRDDRAKTDFSEMSATFTIQNGVATNSDLNMVGPLVRTTGEGTIDIGNERVDYSALPRIVASLEGQGAQIEKGRGIAIPVKINGPWEGAKVKVDLERMMNDPELAQNAINEVGKALENKEDLNKLLKGFFGGGNQQQGTGGTPQGEQVNPGDILKNLFKKQ